MKKTEKSLTSNVKKTSKNFDIDFYNEKGLEKIQKDFENSKKGKIKKQKRLKKIDSKMNGFSLFEKPPIIEKNTKASDTIKGWTFYNLKNYKKDIDGQIEKLYLLKNKYSENENLVNLIEKQIQKKFFYIQTYSQQVFDLYFNSDTLTKYNFDLLHFDLLLKNENLNNQLLYYRLTDTKKRDKNYDTFIFTDDYIRGVVFDKTEKNIINQITYNIIINEISKNDGLKLEFIKNYYKNFDSITKDTNTRKTISNYKKYIIDRYGYLLSD